MALTSLVFSVHGVESLGEWQENVVDPSFEGIEGLAHKPHKYGWFSVFRIFLPWSRRKEVRKFAAFYDKFCKENSIRPSVIAHSFGTYIVTTALSRHHSMEFDRVVLCGSIVSKDYPWTQLVGKKVTAVRNELASEDKVVKLLQSPIVRWLIPRAGPSGIEGFTNPPDAVSSVPSKYTHSEHFLMLKHCNRYWRPFIRGQEQFTDLCYSCSSGDSTAWKAFEREYTPIIRDVARVIFRNQSEEWLEGQIAAVVYEVAKRGCEGTHGAEKLAINIFTEIKTATLKRQR